METECWEMIKVLRQKRLSVTNAGGIHCELLIMQVERARPSLRWLGFPYLPKLYREMLSADFTRAQFLYDHEFLDKNLGSKEQEMN